MKIRSVRSVEYTTSFEHAGEFWEERLIRPVDIYPEFALEPPATVERTGSRIRMSAIFVHVDTDDGITGTAGPITETQALIAHDLGRAVLVGADPLATERLWDTMYRYAIHGRKGVEMMALSALDCALWDVKGQFFGVPAYVLLGGPVRDRIPAYASALGSSLEPEAVRHRTKELVGRGFQGLKWFPRWGAWDGLEALKRTVELIGIVREAAGPDVEIMVDAWMSWDVPHTVAMIDPLRELGVKWIEEPVQPDEVNSYVEIMQRVSGRMLIAGGEHEYTRWGMQSLMDRHAMDIYQPDTYWAGGLTEMSKIAALASVHDVPVIPHGHSVPANAQFSFAQAPSVTPVIEYLVKWNTLHQQLLKHPLHPVNGYIERPDHPGMGMELDEERIETRHELWSTL
jgi:L-alanine-DL-glutamate epimerase-like enolase superfamily enzyme